MTGFHERAKMRENISHGCKAMRGKAPGRVACLEFAEGEKRTAITTDRAVEENFHGIIVPLWNDARFAI